MGRWTKVAETNAKEVGLEFAGASNQIQYIILAWLFIGECNPGERETCPPQRTVARTVAAPKTPMALDHSRAAKCFVIYGAERGT